MKLLLVNVIGTKREYIISKCISSGIEVFHSDSIDGCHKILSSVDITHLFIDFESRKIDWFEYLKSLRAMEDGNKYQVIVISKSNKKEFVQDLLKLGVIGFVQAMHNAEETYKKLNEIMRIGDKRDPRRKHFRVKIPATEEIKINFKMPNKDKFITGKVTDVSIVAIAFRLNNPVDRYDYAEGQIIEKVQLRIKNKNIMIRMKIIKEGPLTVASFYKVKETILSTISHFVYDRMLKDIVEA